MRFAAIAVLIAFGVSPAEAQDVRDAITRPAKVITVEQTATKVERRYSAIVRPSQEAELSFKVSGQVIDLPVRGATTVDEGDVIAQLDKRQFEANVAQLQSQVEQAEAQLSALKSGARVEEISAFEADVSAAQAQVTQAEDQLARTRQLFDEGIVAQARLDQDLAATQVAQASLKAAQEQLAIGKAGGRAEDVAASEAALRGLQSQIKIAQDNLDDTTLRAPFKGIIARRDIENFTNIQAGQKIVLLQALNKVDLAFDVPSPDVLIWSSNDDTAAAVELDALPGGPVAADLVEFSTQADSGTQTYRVEVSIDVPKGNRVLPGMVGTVIVSSEAAANPAISVPLTAVASAADASPFVWVVAPGTNAVSGQPVTLGDVSGDRVQVASGLEPGAMIVTAGVSSLREGAMIRPISKVGE